MEKFRVIVAGSRNFHDYDKLCGHLDPMIKCLLAAFEVVIVSGGCGGTDALGERYANENGLAIEVYNANWDKYGKSAGPRRNAEMANVADGLLAFWDGESRGTKNMIDNIKRRKKVCVTVELDV